MSTSGKPTGGGAIRVAEECSLSHSFHAGHHEPSRCAAAATHSSGPMLMSAAAAVLKGIKLLLVQAGKAEGLRQELASLKERGVPYMFVGKPIENAGAITMVSGDNRALGVDAARYIVDTLTKKYGKPKGNIVLLEGIPGDETSVNRIGGVTSVTGKSADIKVIARQPADYRRPKAYAVMQDQGSANPASVVVQLSASTTEISTAC
jgi:ABC-type sugar transport system substrate-binding protein